MLEKILVLDQYGEQLWFNYQGSLAYKTWLGVLLTLFTYLAVASNALIKFNDMVQRNETRFYTKQLERKDASYLYNAGEHNFGWVLAINLDTFEEFNEQEIKELHEEYIEVRVSVQKSKNAVRSKSLEKPTKTRMNICTPDQVDDEQSTKFREMLDMNSQIYCFEDSSLMAIN